MLGRARPGPREGVPPKREPPYAGHEGQKSVLVGHAGRSVGRHGPAPPPPGCVSAWMESTSLTNATEVPALKPFLRDQKRQVGIWSRALLTSAKVPAPELATPSIKPLKVRWGLRRIWSIRLFSSPQRGITPCEAREVSPLGKTRLPRGLGQVLMCLNTVRGVNGERAPTPRAPRAEGRRILDTQRRASVDTSWRGVAEARPAGWRLKGGCSDRARGPGSGAEPRREENRLPWWRDH